MKNEEWVKGKFREGWGYLFVGYWEFYVAINIAGNVVLSMHMQKYKQSDKYLGNMIDRTWWWLDKEGEEELCVQDDY